jgi:hypothetical protein
MPAPQQGGVTQADIHGHGNDMWPEGPRKISGKVIKTEAEVIIIFKVRGKYYPNTEHNAALMETYLHTNDPQYLNDFENEVEF